MHPIEVIHLEHDGKVLLVNENGDGPQQPLQGREIVSEKLRLPSRDEVDALDIDWKLLRETRIVFGTMVYRVLKGYPKIEWPKSWAWKDDLIADNAVNHSSKHNSCFT